MFHSKQKPVLILCDDGGIMFPVVLTRFAHIVVGILSYSSAQIFSRAVMCLGITDYKVPPQMFSSVEVWTLTWQLQNLDLLFRGTQRLIGCELWIIVMLEAQPNVILTALTDGRRFLSKVSLCMPSLMQITGPEPFEGKHLQSMMILALSTTIVHSIYSFWTQLRFFSKHREQCLYQKLLFEWDLIDHFTFY